MWQIDTSKQGLLAILRKWHVALIQFLLKTKTGISSRIAYEHLKDEGIKISRASVINYLKELDKAGILSNIEVSGKGGYHKVYTMTLDQEGFENKIVKDTLNALQSAFPENEYLRKLKAI